MINTSRGALINEEALLEALEDHRLSGAALDVVQNEMNVDESNDLVRYAKSHDNLLIVPHLGGNTFESFEKTELFLAQKIIESLNQ